MEVSVSSPQLLPEERIRQHLLQVLIEKLGYPKSRVVIEKELSLLPHLLGKNVPKRRLDVLVYDHELRPLIVFECKAAKVTQDALDQVLGYNHVIEAPFVAVVGDGEVLACDKGGNVIGGLMKYEELVAMR